MSTDAISPDIQAAARAAAERILIKAHHQDGACPHAIWVMDVIEEELAKVLVNRVAFCPSPASGDVVQGFANRAGSTAGEPPTCKHSLQVAAEDLAWHVGIYLSSLGQFRDEARADMERAYAKYRKAERD